MQFIFHAFSSLKKANTEIVSLIKKHYSVDGEYFRFIENNLRKFFKPLRSNLNVMIEYPYVDKVYRDSYYNYFATKYKDYRRDCVRISFFSSNVQERDIYDEANPIFLGENFMGYCVLRPTFPDVIGRNLIRKSALKNQNFVTCIHEENVMVNGIKLPIKGFPHSSQDGESITCAETTIWAIMEYFGHKYAEYKPVLPSTILNKLNDYSDKRMLPSNGLTTDQISFALKDFGFGTMCYTEKDDKENFFPNLSVYVESGFPVITSLESDDEEYGHAILMIGRQNFSAQDLINAHALADKDDNIISFTSVIKKYVVQDDNLPPYSLIPLDKPGTHYEPGDGFESFKIKAFVVPLYKKMYMEVQKARKFFEEIFKDPKYGSKTKQKHIFRMYMASSRSYKEHIAQQNGLDKTLKTFLLTVSMPRFIWCGEYINAEDAPKKNVSSLIVLDATEGGENWEDSFIFAAHKNISLFYVAVDHTYRLIPLKKTFAGFLMYEHNLN